MPHSWLVGCTKCTFVQDRFFIDCMGLYSERWEVLATKLDEMITQHHLLRKENRDLQGKVEGLSESLERKELQFSQLEKEVEGMKVAAALSGDDTRRATARAEVNKMLREVEQCIALLND